MSVLLIHVDGKMPNLALMKISAWHKKRGDRIFLKRGLSRNLPLKCHHPDKVYISCVFDQNKVKALKLAEGFKCPVEIGGYGVNSNRLPEEVEHIRPDYDLYGVDYSMGFTSRGCIRRCPWCVVPKKEGYIRFHTPIDEFLKPSHNKIILLDNNFLASPKWHEELIKLIAYRLKVNFSQGLDIRLIDQENVRFLSKVHYYDWKFKRRRLHFAFDSPQIEDEVIQGIETLERGGIRREHLMFYVLVGYNTDYAQDLHRINLLIKEGVKPYVMPYNDRHDSYYPHLERWVNHRYYKLVSWEKYDSGNSQEIIRKMGSLRMGKR